MKIGMLWFDDDPKSSLTERIVRAADYYSRKYGRPPTLCLLHPATAGVALPESVGGLELRTNASVLREHLWIGVADTPPAAA